MLREHSKHPLVQVATRRKMWHASQASVREAHGAVRDANAFCWVKYRESYVGRQGAGRGAAGAPHRHRCLRGDARPGRHRRRCPRRTAAARVALGAGERVVGIWCVSGAGRRSPFTCILTLTPLRELYDRGVLVSARAGWSWTMRQRLRMVNVPSVLYGRTPRGCTTPLTTAMVEHRAGVSSRRAGRSPGVRTALRFVKPSRLLAWIAAAFLMDTPTALRRRWGGVDGPKFRPPDGPIFRPSILSVPQRRRLVDV